MPYLNNGIRIKKMYTMSMYCIHIKKISWNYLLSETDIHFHFEAYQIVLSIKTC